MSAPVPLPRASLTSRQVDPRGIAAFLDAVEADGIELHSLMLYRGGAVVAEAFWKPYAADIPHMMHSATKSWVACAVGLLIDDGKLALDDRVIDFFPEDLPATVSDNLAAMTVRDLLTMQSGHRTGLSGGEWRGMTESWTRAFFREPVEDVPGRTFIYSSGCSYILSAIVTKRTGRLAADLIAERIGRPLGMGPLPWDVSPEGVSTGGNGLSCTTEDFLKLGVLHLQKGRWNGQQILSEAWVRDATRGQVAEVWMGSFDGRRYGARDPSGPKPEERREGYGYQWWMSPHGAFHASGLFGQQCIVMPEQDAVLAYTAALAKRDPRLTAHVWAHLFPALGAVAAASEAEAALAKRLGGLHLADPDGDVQGPLAAELNGRTYVMAPNADNVARIGFTFGPTEGRFTLEDHRGTHIVAFGLGHGLAGETTVTGHYLHHEYEPGQMRVVASGVWTDPKTFRMTWRFVETAFADTVVCRFDGDGVVMERSVNTNSSALSRPPISGTAAAEMLTPAKGG